MTLANKILEALKKSPWETAVIVFVTAAVIYTSIPTPASVRATEDVETPVATEEVETAPEETEEVAEIASESAEESVVPAVSATDLQMNAVTNEHRAYGQLPESADRGPIYKYQNIPVSAYNSVPWQTDSTPCIGAQGTDICALLAQGSNTCAANFLPLGTTIEVEGVGTCVVRDRMNARYHYRVDWYMGNDVSAARTFGVQYKNIGIYPEN